MPSNTLIDMLVQHAHSLEDFKNSQVVSVVGTFNDSGVAGELAQDISRRLDNITNLQANARVGYLRDAINENLMGALTEAKQELMDGLAGILETEAAFQAKALQGIAPAGVTVSTPTAETILKVSGKIKIQGRTINAWLKGIARKGTSKIMKAIRSGKSLDDSLKAIIGTRAAQFSDGVLNQVRQQLEAVTRTAVQAVSAEAQEAVFADNKNLVRAVQMVAVLDSRTTAFCQNIDGKVYPIDSGPRPPFHWNCRTTMTPVLKTWGQLGITDPTKEQKALFSGDPMSRLTYSDWLARQTPEIQDQALGKTRADLYRSGKVDVKRFVNMRGRLLTLDELRDRENL